ncbi:MAPEG family protein [Acanthopleuribacter pedis]|uniref:Microsomal glutathione S-transferase 1 n=1 Tax=Acanthopleuribacter pedis TaxID=442870 RepID=A0A8J7QJL5_9BACT|nr:MAPEG family protein [Acanthopleuribacter pedis]MBO1319405.1 MAPEG family protein [Acanthopleuribacter pedis]
MNSSIFDTPLFSVFALVLIAETLKTLVLGTATAWTRGQLKQFINQEDAAWLGGETVVVEHPDPARLGRAHRNNLENLVPFLALGGIYLLSGAAPLMGMFYFGGFFLARAAHTAAYLTQRPLLRRNSYAAAWLILIVTGIHAGTRLIGQALSL